LYIWINNEIRQARAERISNLLNNIDISVDNGMPVSELSKIYNIPDLLAERIYDDAYNSDYTLYSYQYPELKEISIEEQYPIYKMNPDIEQSIADLVRDIAEN
jgi:hypothetical protein